MAGRYVSRRILDLTPLLDVIMILLFGAMINSVELVRLGTSEAREEAEQASERLLTTDQEVAQLQQQKKELESKLAVSEAQRRSIEQRLQIEKIAAAETIGRLIGIDADERRALEQQIGQLTDARPEELAQKLAEMEQTVSGQEISRALRRIQEMQKVFTFVDLHIDDNDFLVVDWDGKAIDRFSVRDRNIEEIQADIRRALESVRFSEVVLLLFSYDGSARDRSVEQSEAAINALLASYRQDPTQRGRQFRFGRIGLVGSPGGS